MANESTHGPELELGLCDECTEGIRRVLNSGVDPDLVLLLIAQSIGAKESVTALASHFAARKIQQLIAERPEKAKALRELARKSYEQARKRIRRERG